MLQSFSQRVVNGNFCVIAISLREEHECWQNAAPFFPWQRLIHWEDTLQTLMVAGAKMLHTTSMLIQSPCCTFCPRDGPTHGAWVTWRSSRRVWSWRGRSRSCPPVHGNHPLPMNTQKDNTLTRLDFKSPHLVKSNINRIFLEMYRFALSAPGAHVLVHNWTSGRLRRNESLRNSVGEVFWHFLLCKTEKKERIRFHWLSTTYAFGLT